MNKKPDEPLSRAGSLPLVAGALALDFCNTCSGRGTEGLKEHVRTANDVVTWARHAAVLDEAAETEIRRLCETDRDFADAFLKRALDLRDATYRLDAALAQGEPPDQVDIDVIAGIHADCLKSGRLTTRDGGFGWSWSLSEAPGSLVIGPIAASAMMILTAADRSRLKQCPGHHCGWLFLDITKNNKRRWCEMEVCGNRAKQKRHRGRSEPDA